MTGLQKQEKILVFVCGILIGSVLVSFLLKKRSTASQDDELRRPSFVQEEVSFLNHFTITDTREVLEIDTGQIRRYTFYADPHEGISLIEETAYKHDSKNERIVMTDRSYYSSNHLWLYTEIIGEEQLLPILDRLQLSLVASFNNSFWLIGIPGSTYQEYIDIQEEIKDFPFAIEYITPDYRFQGYLESGDKQLK